MKEKNATAVLKYVFQREKIENFVLTFVPLLMKCRSSKLKYDVLNTNFHDMLVGTWTNHRNIPPKEDRTLMKERKIRSQGSQRLSRWAFSFFTRYGRWFVMPRQSIALVLSIVVNNEGCVVIELWHWCYDPARPFGTCTWNRYQNCPSD